MIPRILAFTLLTLSLSAVEPERLTKMRGSYEAAMTKATAPIQKTYIAELEKMKMEFTKSGKLEEALAVEQEIRKLIPEAAPAPVMPDKVASPATQAGKKSLRTYLMSNQWTYGPPNATNTQKAIFHEDGRLEMPGAAASFLNYEFTQKGALRIGGVEAAVKVGDTEIVLPKFSPTKEDRVFRLAK